MTHRLSALLCVGVLVALLVAPGGGVLAAPAPPDTVATPVADNDFIPARDLDDCISALPQPGCGSESRGGWRQWAVFGVLVVGLSFIAWRIAVSIRRARRDT